MAEDLGKQFADVRRRINAIRAELAPLERKAEKLRAAADQAEAAWRTVREQIAGLESARDLAGLSRRQAQLARETGARGILAEPAR